MPVFNGAPYVGEAIESIMGQTYERLELLIVDNASTDKTKEVLKAYKKRFPNRIKLYTFGTNEGAFIASNFALTKAKGRYIAMMDADDIAHKTRIAKEVSYLEANSGTVVVGSQATIIDGRGRIIGKKTLPTIPAEIYKQFAVVNPLVHPSVMFNRNLLPNPAALYTTKYGVNDDYYTFFKLMPYGTFANLPEALLKYRVHGKNSSLNHLKKHFWTITNIRIEAITKLNYQAPLYVFPVMLVQALVVTLLPEALLKEMFYYLRGIKTVSMKISFPLPVMMYEKIKSYATLFLA